ncbi:MAG TPA: c-type cytochrome domain-containing protein [Phycisphaerales bacterium]|nr:c-type cytochrome domain-containing protein [Phycisphaerales bacterium]
MILTAACLSFVLTVPPVDGPIDPTSPEAVARDQQPAAGTTPLAGPEVETAPSGRGDPAMRPEGNVPMRGNTGVSELFARRCASCHGPNKQKAGIRVMPISALFEGDQADWVVVPGQPQASELFKRISLPAGHEDIMPSKDSPLNTAEIAMVEAWIKDNMSTKALIDSAGMVEKGGRVDPRTWAAAYLSLDLTATQRNDATKTMQTLMSKMREQRAARQGQGRPQNRGDAQPDSPATKPAGDTPPNDRSNRQGMQDVQKKIGQEQSRLWEALSPKQQEAMRALLDDPEAIKKLRRANRGVRRGPDSGARRPGRPSGTGDQPRD